MHGINSVHGRGGDGYGANGVDCGRSAKQDHVVIDVTMVVKNSI